MAKPAQRPRVRDDDVSRCPQCGSWRHFERCTTCHPRAVGADVTAVTSVTTDSTQAAETTPGRTALVEVVNLLGPRSVCTCHAQDCGLVVEAADALDVAKRALADTDPAEGLNVHRIEP